MTDRLTPQDAALLRAEDAHAPLQVGTVLLLEPDTVDAADLVEAIIERTSAVRRLRQRVREVPGRLADPVWADDAEFDPSWHVRRSAVPAPGGAAQLEEFVARIVSRRLDRTRPLWEAHVVEGVAGGRLAVVTVCHEVLVDGLSMRDVSELVLDPQPGEPTALADTGTRRDPLGIELLLGAVGEVARDPGSLLRLGRQAVGEVGRTGRSVLGVGARTGAALVRLSTDTAPSSPLQVPVGTARRYRTSRLALDDLRSVRDAASARGTVATVHDVALTVLTGALREWLESRGLPVTTGTTIRAMVPVSVHATGHDPSDGAGAPSGGHLLACFVNLPVGEPDAELRLSHVAHAMSVELRQGLGVSADLIAALPGFAPPTLHSLGSRLSAALTRRTHGLVVTNAPGPREPRRLLGAEVTGTWPVLPLSPDKALSVGMTSYTSGLHLGLLADRRAVPDLDVIVGALPTSLRELALATGATLSGADAAGAGSH